VDSGRILDLMRECDVVLDGTDNFEVRLLINDASLETGIPWVNGGCVGSTGQVMTIIPGVTACFRCLVADEPEAGTTETCDTAGVLAPAVNVVASLQVIEALKLLTGQRNLIEPVLTVVDVWEGTSRRLKLGDLPAKSDCPACRHGERRWLRGEAGSSSTVLCGRNSVQVSPGSRGTLDLAQLAEKLRSSGKVTSNPFLVKLSLPEGETEITVFRDGRAIIKGTEDIATARALYARYVGH
jgi:adenylyltransferase/sulfurtransferase